MIFISAIRKNLSMGSSCVYTTDLTKCRNDVVDARVLLVPSVCPVEAVLAIGLSYHSSLTDFSSHNPMV
jgi:hypothetical protein